MIGMSNFTTNRIKTLLGLLLTPAHQSHQSLTLPPSILLILGDEYAFLLVMRIFSQLDEPITHNHHHLHLLLQIPLPVTTSPMISPRSFLTIQNRMHWDFGAYMRNVPHCSRAEIKALMRSVMLQPSRPRPTLIWSNLKLFPDFPPKIFNPMTSSPRSVAQLRGFSFAGSTLE